MSPARDRVFAATVEGAGECTALETSRDAFLDGRVMARQPVDGPRAAIDALFLAAAVPAIEGRGDKVLEAGLGAGVASLAIAARVPDVYVTGVEVQPRLCELARGNVRLNGIEDRMAVVEADLTAPAGVLAESGLVAGSFAHVVANPPYLIRSDSRVSPDEAIATAHAADERALENWVRFLARMAGARASVTLIHRADALDRLLDCLGGRFGGLTVFPLFPRADAPAKRVIVQGIKGSRAPLVVTRGLVLHEADGGYTKEADAILRDGEALMLLPDR